MHVLVYDMDKCSRHAHAVLRNLSFMHMGEDLRFGYINRGGTGRVKRVGEVWHTITS